MSTLKIFGDNPRPEAGRRRNGKKSVSVQRNTILNTNSFIHVNSWVYKIYSKE